MGADGSAAGGRALVLGLFTDPGAPDALVRRIATELPDALVARLGGDADWDVRVADERLPAGPRGRYEMLDRGRERMGEEGWDYAVCVTDVPLRMGDQTLVAETASDRVIGVLSLAGCGGTFVRRRAIRVLVELVVLLVQGSSPGSSRTRGDDRVDGRDRLPGGIERVEPVRKEYIDVRFVVPRSRLRLRLLAGMVHLNRPWRLMLGLTGAFVTAFAFSVFWVVNVTVWQLAADLGVLRALLLMGAAVGGWVVWLILGHHLWETRNARGRQEGEDLTLFNVSTVLTLLVGVGCGYAALFVLNLLAAVLVVDAGVFAAGAGSAPTAGTYLMLAWVATSLGELAGAIGTKLDTDEAVRQAAYSRRSHERPPRGYTPRS